MKGLQYHVKVVKNHFVIGSAKHVSMMSIHKISIGILTMQYLYVRIKNVHNMKNLKIAVGQSNKKKNSVKYV